MSRATTKEAPRRDNILRDLWGWWTEEEREEGGRWLVGWRGLFVLEKEIRNVRLGGQNAK